MLRGERVGLRARREADVPILHEELHDDISCWVRMNWRPWRPIDASTGPSPYRVQERSDDKAPFSVVELDSDELAGSALLWGIDPHNRLAHIGIGLRPTYRGRGLA